MEKLGINAGFLIAQLVNFGFIFVVLLYAWPRILKMLDGRAAKIAKSLEDARVAEQARANAERDAQKILDERRAEGAKLVEEARGRAEQQAKSVLDEAQRAAEAAKAKALQEGEEARNAMLGDLRTDVVKLAMAAAERLIGQSLDAKKSATIISNFFSKSGEEVKGLGDTIEVTSALPLEDSERASVVKQTGAKDIIYKVDPSILGGLVVRAGDRVVDGSVRAGLEAMSGRLR